MSRFTTARRFIAPLATAGVVGGVLYQMYRPLNIPGYDGPVVPPPIFGADGTFKLPRFPRIKSRLEQISELKKSNSGNGDDVYDVLVIGAGATGAGVALLELGNLLEAGLDPRKSRELESAVCAVDGRRNSRTFVSRNVERAVHGVQHAACHARRGKGRDEAPGCREP